MRDVLLDLRPGLKVAVGAGWLSLAIAAALGIADPAAPQAVEAETASTGLEDGLVSVRDDTGRFSVDLPVAFAASTTVADLDGRPVAHVSAAVDLDDYLAGDPTAIGTSIFVTSQDEAGAREDIIELIGNRPGQVIGEIAVPGTDDLVIASVRAPAPSTAQRLLTALMGTVTALDRPEEH
jgi:hypothetical protein